jgi:hypothetical protein
MSLAVQLSTLACALGAVVFATVSGRSVRALLMAGVMFAAPLAWPPLVTGSVASGAMGLVIALVAVARLAGWTRLDLPALMAGWLTGGWAVLLQTAGVPLWAGVALAAALSGVAVVQSMRRESFAPARLCEDALVVVALVGVCAAAAPGLAEGWRAAVNLKFGGATQAAASVPAWAVAVSLTAAAAGAGYGAWSRR